MVRVHFVGGDYIDIHNTSHQELADQLKRFEKAKYIHFNDTTVVIDNVTYIESVEEVKKTWEESN